MSLAGTRDLRRDFVFYATTIAVRQCQWHNKRQGRKGTLWEDRYKSVLVEGDPKALLTMAAYIDLN